MPDIFHKINAITLSPLGDKEKLFVLNDFFKNSKDTIITFYETLVNSFLPILENTKKMRGVNKKIAKFYKKIAK